MLVNDVTWAIDEALSSLQRIRANELDMPSWQALAEVGGGGGWWRKA
jgi:hypothetical protein